MTTQDHHTETTDSTEAVESSTAGTDPSTVGTDPSTAETDSTEEVESSTRGTDPSTVGTGTPLAGTDPPTEKSLFGEDELSAIRSRWDDVQAGFVDDPRDCVQKADGLVSDVVDQLTTGFSEARSRLEAQWSRGEEASTEDLRLALKRYREFFQRLLAV
jgi:hypothetical protein